MTTSTTGIRKKVHSNSGKSSKNEDSIQFNSIQCYDANAMLVHLHFLPHALVLHMMLNNLHRLHTSLVPVMRYSMLLILPVVVVFVVLVLVSLGNNFQYKVLLWTQQEIQQNKRPIYYYYYYYYYYLFSQREGKEWTETK